MTKRIRDLISGQITLDYFMRKAAEGWTLAAVEWIREVEDDAAEMPPLAAGLTIEEVPYGLRISADGLRLEESPFETSILLTMLEKIVREKRLSEIAAELNDAGFKTRRGGNWTAASVFDLLPRLIEAGPTLLNTAEWRRRRTQISTPPAPHRVQ